MFFLLQTFFLKRTTSFKKSAELNPWFNNLQKICRFKFKRICWPVQIFFQEIFRTNSLYVCSNVSNGFSTPSSESILFKEPSFKTIPAFFLCIYLFVCFISVSVKSIFLSENEFYCNLYICKFIRFDDIWCLSLLYFFFFC